MITQKVTILRLNSGESASHLMMPLCERLKTTGQFQLGSVEVLLKGNFSEAMIQEILSDTDFAVTTVDEPMRQKNPARFAMFRGFDMDWYPPEIPSKCPFIPGFCYYD